MRTPDVIYGRHNRGIKTELSAQYFAIIFKAVFFYFTAHQEITKPVANASGIRKRLTYIDRLNGC